MLSARRSLRRGTLRARRIDVLSPEDQDAEAQQWRNWEQWSERNEREWWQEQLRERQEQQQPVRQQRPVQEWRQQQCAKRLRLDIGFVGTQRFRIVSDFGLQLLSHQ